MIVPRQGLWDWDWDEDLIGPAFDWFDDLDDSWGPDGATDLMAR